jgi:hypothetical protein
MQKWWLIGAGVVGVALAVLLLGRPLDTGEDVGASTGVRYDAQGRLIPGSSEGVVRGPNGEPLPAGEVGPDGAPALTTGSIAMIKDGTRPNAIGNPLARRMAEARATPEGHFASRTQAPWTQVRREIAGKAPDDPAAAELVAEVNDVVTKLRETRRAPTTMDFEALATQQKDLMARIRQSPYHDERVEEMLAMVDQRFAEYEVERTTGVDAEGE